MDGWYSLRSCYAFRVIYSMRSTARFIHVRLKTDGMTVGSFHHALVNRCSLCISLLCRTMLSPFFSM